MFYGDVEMELGGERVGMGGLAISFSKIYRFKIGADTVLLYKPPPPLSIWLPH